MGRRDVTARRAGRQGPGGGRRGRRAGHAAGCAALARAGSAYTRAGPALLRDQRLARGARGAGERTRWPRAAIADRRARPRPGLARRRAPGRDRAAALARGVASTGWRSTRAASTTWPRRSPSCASGCWPPPAWRCCSHSSAATSVAQALARRVQRLEEARRAGGGGALHRARCPWTPRTSWASSRARSTRCRCSCGRVDVARKEFVATASHELRTPIFSLGGFVELLQDEELDAATRREFLDTMAEQVERLQKLAVDLLDLSRLDAGSVELAREPVDLSELARAIAGEFKPAVDAPRDRAGAAAAGPDQGSLRPGTGGSDHAYPARQCASPHPGGHSRDGHGGARERSPPADRDRRGPRPAGRPPGVRPLLHRRRGPRRRARAWPSRGAGRADGRHACAPTPGRVGTAFTLELPAALAGEAPRPRPCCSRRWRSRAATATTTPARQRPTRGAEGGAHHPCRGRGGDRPQGWPGRRAALRPALARRRDRAVAVQRRRRGAAAPARTRARAARARASCSTATATWPPTPTW